MGLSTSVDGSSCCRILLKGSSHILLKVSSHLLLLFQLYTFLALTLLLFAFTLSFLALALLLLILTLLLLILTLSCYLRHETLVLVPQRLALSFSSLEYLECGCCSCFSV